MCFCINFVCLRKRSFAKSHRKWRLIDTTAKGWPNPVWHTGCFLERKFALFNFIGRIEIEFWQLPFPTVPKFRSDGFSNSLQRDSDLCRLPGITSFLSGTSEGSGTQWYDFWFADAFWFRRWHYFPGSFLSATSSIDGGQGVFLCKFIRLGLTGWLTELVLLKKAGWPPGIWVGHAFFLLLNSGSVLLVSTNWLVVHYNGSNIACTKKNDHPTHSMADLELRWRFQLSMWWHYFWSLEWHWVGIRIVDV